MTYNTKNLLTKASVPPLLSLYIVISVFIFTLPLVSKVLPKELLSLFYDWKFMCLQR